MRVAAVRQGGIRTEAFVWSPLLPDAVGGTAYTGLMHVADWKATYASGVAGMSREDVVAFDAGPFPDESVNHWDAIVGGAGVAGPRQELITAVHSAKHYPGNCSMSAWESRSCAAVIHSGDLKMMLGFVGDPRVLVWNESTNGQKVPFGLTEGTCGIYGHDDRCTSPGRGGRPAPEPSDPGGCLCECCPIVRTQRAVSRRRPISGLGDPRRCGDGAMAQPWLTRRRVQPSLPQTVACST